MIDFQNKILFKLKAEDPRNGYNAVSQILINDEKVLYSYVALRDRVVFTDKRIISINVQGISGTKKDFTSIPYNKIQTFSVETAGTLDLDAELDICISGLGVVRFELRHDANVLNICRLISEYILS